MDLESPTCHQEKEKQGLFGRGWSWIKAFPKNVNTMVFEFFSKVKKLGQDDPRRVVHSLKVGLALTLVSILYYYRPLYDSFGLSALWAVMTVVVVFEFSVGATLGKCVNRGLATLLAGALAVGAHHLANLSGRIGEPMVLGFFVFLQAAVFTFARFYPKIKARYDYGLLIFILTFSFASVSGYRDDEILELAYNRLSTILIGGFTCIIVSTLVFPVWAGQDLHNLIASNIGKLGSFLEGFGDEYFEMAEDGESKQDKSFLQGYKTVLNSKNNEDALAKPEIRSKIQETCTKMSLESGKALKELAFAIKTMVKPFPVDIHIENSKSAAKNLNSVLKSSGLWDDNMDLLQAVPVAIVASLLIDVVNCTEEIAESVHELASMVNFEAVKSTVSPEKPETGQSEPVKSSSDVNSPSVILVIGEPSRENGSSSATAMDNCNSGHTN